MAHAFTYGSLMWPDIMARVSGHERPSESANLADHARHPVLGQDYPGMVPCAGAAVSGRLYRDLDERAWARLDAFEGPGYERREVELRLPDGTAVTAYTYIFKPGAAQVLAAGDWDVERFEREGKARFIARYAGFDQLGEW